MAGWKPTGIPREPQRINSLSSKATPVDGDVVWIEDSADGYSPKKATLGSLPGGGGGGGAADLVTFLEAAAVSIANSAAVAVGFSTEARDDGGWHDTVTNNSRVTVAAAGEYAITGAVEWDANNTGVRIIFIRVNGGAGSSIVGQQVPAANDQVMSFAGMEQLAIGDYVELYCFQTSGGTRTVDAQLTVTKKA